MTRKILIWSVFILFSILLLIGALNRTLVKLADTRGTDGERGNVNRTVAAETAMTSTDSANPVAGAAPVVTPGMAAENGAVLESQSADQESEKHAARVPIVQNGRVDFLKRNNATLVLDDARVVNFSGRGWRYAQSLGFSIQTGDVLAFDGYEEQGTIKIKSLTNLRNGQSVVLRDESGHPLWEEGEDG